MRIKQSASKSTFSQILRDKFQSKAAIVRVLLVVFSLLVIAVLSFGILLYGAQQKRMSQLTYSKSSLLKIAEFDFSPIKTLFQSSTGEFKEMDLILDGQHWPAISTYKSSNSTHIHIDSTGKEFPATLIINNHSYQVRVFVEAGDIPCGNGDLSQLIRIYVKDNQRVEDMGQFVLVNPYSLKYLNNWLGGKLAGERDVMCLQSDFVRLKINSKKSGIYFLQEEFSDLEINYERFEEGTLFRSESEIPILTNSYNGLNDSQQELQSTGGVGFSLPKEASQLEQIFHVEKWARLFAIADVLILPQLLLPDNVGFYHNPETEKVEPVIGKFNFRGIENPSQFISVLERSAENSKWHSILAFHPLVAQLTQFESFKRQYLAEVKEISQLEFIDDFYLRHGDHTAALLKEVFKDSAGEELPLNIWQGRRRLVHDRIFPDRTEIYAWFNGMSDHSIHLSLCSQQEMPIEVSSVSWRDSIFFLPSTSIMLQDQSRGEGEPVSSFDFKIASDFAWNDSLIPELQVDYHLSGMGADKRSVRVFPYPYSLARSKIGNPVNREANHLSFPFIIEHDTSGIITIPEGQWTLGRDLVIPSKKQFHIEPGATIDLIHNAKILSYSPVIATGQINKPITFKSSDLTGEGLTIIGAKQRSYFSHVLFEGQSRPAEDGWQLTGAVTFYESPVDFASCTFSKNQIGDDYLNIIRSDFTMDSVLFIDIVADAFDCDFCTGSVSQSAFVNIGNDGVDISGSDIDVIHVFMRQVGDKGLSAGEKSKIRARWIKIQDAEIAITSKDRSEFILADATLVNSRIGITLFQKKTEFGPAYLAAQRIDISGSEIPYLVEPDSHLEIDGKIIMANKENIKEILYGIEYGRSSD